jgi:hypothetical protein
MVRESGIRNLDFILDISDDQAFWMRGQQELHDAKAGLGSHRGEHVRVSGDMVDIWLGVYRFHISMIAEI